jgi:hypothetical protein
VELLDLLDRILDAHWPAALAGDVRAVALCRRALQLQAKILC